MASAIYMTNRQAYTRPQAIVWTDEYSIESGLFVPVGVEYSNFLILSDHGRGEIAVGSERIENRKRMINGTMRSYHIADKMKYSWDWEMLPSRAFNAAPAFNSSGIAQTPNLVNYTVDKGAGGSDIVDWYLSHKGPFWMLLSYDKPAVSYADSKNYVEARKVYISDFSYNIVKRGVTDFWDISVSVEEA